MTPKQAIKQLECLPETEVVQIIFPERAKAARIERDGVMSFRFARSLKVAVTEMLDRISLVIGSQRRDEQFDFIVSEMNEVIDRALQAQTCPPEGPSNVPPTRECI